MGMFTRFTDIVNSNINAMLDKAEDPEKIIRLLIEEMESTLVDARSDLARILSEKKALVRKQTNLESAANDWQNKAELAIQKDRDDLARSALIEKQKLSEESEQVNKELAEVERVLSSFQADIATLQAKLADAKQRQKSMMVRQQSSQQRLKVREQLVSNNVEEMMHRFEAYERRLDNIEAEVESYDMTSSPSLEQEFWQLEHNEKIDNELNALKAKLSA